MPQDQPDTLPPFSIWLSNYLKENELSQEELAKELEVGVRTIQHWIRGDARPPRAELTRILYKLNFHYSEKMIQQLLRKTLPVDPPDPPIHKRHYCEQLISTYNSLDFSGFERVDSSLKDIPLEKIFLRLTLLQDTKEQDQLSEIASLLPLKSISLPQALSKHLLLVGEPGGGKSTLLKWLAITFAQGKQQDVDRLGGTADPHRIPLLVELKNVGEPHSWFSFLPSYITQQDAFRHVPAAFINEALENGQCLVLFDGLDEIADRRSRTRLLQSLRTFAQQAQGNRLVISSRLAGLSKNETTLHPLFHFCQIERFTPEEVHRFFSQWYDLDPTLAPEHQQADDLFQQVKAQPHLLQLAQTPLLCTMILLLWRSQNASLPQQRARLYDRFCRMILDQWEGHHTVALHDQELIFTPDEQLQFLAHLAYVLHTHEHQKPHPMQGNKAELCSCLTTHLQEIRYATPALAQGKAERLLELLGNRSGLMQYQGKDLDGQERYTFTHLTFQEYLTARYLATLPYDDWIDSIMTHLHDAWWLQVHLLTISIVSTQEAKTAYIPSLLSIIYQQYPPATGWTSYHLSGHDALSGRRDALYWHSERYLNWILGRNLTFCLVALDECADSTSIWQSPLGQRLLDQSEQLLLQMLAAWERAAAQQKLLLLLLQTLLCHRKKSITPRLLQELANSECTDILTECLSELAKASNDAAIQILLLGLQVPSLEIREAILEHMDLAILSGHSALFQMVIQALYGPEEKLQLAALASLEKAALAKYQPALQAILNATAEIPQAISRLASVAASGSPQALDCLVAFARHTDIFKRNFAITGLGKLTSIDDPQIIGMLRLALNDSSQKIQSSAATSLIQLVAAGHTQALQFFIALLQNGKQGLHAFLTTIELRFSAQSSHALQLVLQTLQYTPNENVLATIIQILQEEFLLGEDLVLNELTSLAVNGNQQALQALLHGAEQHSYLEQKFYILRLGPIAATGQQQALDLLLKAQHHSDESIQSIALHSLGRVAAAGNQQILDLLFQAFQHSGEQIRKGAIEGLGWVARGSHQKALEALLEALEDPSLDVCLAAVHALEPLAIVGNEQAIQGLINALAYKTYTHQDGYILENGRIQETAFYGLLQAVTMGQEQVLTRLVNAIPQSDLQRVKIARPLVQRGGITNEQFGAALIHDLRYADMDIRRETIMVCESLRETEELQLISSEQLQRILLLLAHHMHAPVRKVRRAAIRALEYLLDGQPFPFYSWRPLHQQRKLKARLRRRGYLSLLFAGMLSLSGTGAVILIYLPSWTLLVFGLLSLLLVVGAVVAFRLGRPLPNDVKKTH